MSNTRLEITTVSPDMAAYFLTMNDVNRPVRSARVNLYADAMKSGDWRLTGDPIVFSSDGKMIQGQHRCHACVKAGVTFTTAIMWGADPGCYAVMDSGLGRKVADVLTHENHPNSVLVGAAARLVIGYRAGVLYDSHQWGRATTRPAILSEVNANRDLYAASATRAKTIGKVTGLSGSALCALMVQSESANSGNDGWFESLRTGANLEVGDPILALRNWGQGARRFNGIIHLSAIIRAWNATATGKRLTLIKPWIRGTPFPSIITSVTLADDESA
jgi:hypothetical protein